ncbi:MAG: hypothetical protein AAF604_05790 [Acidobacteriota bacterium]
MKRTALSLSVLGVILMVAPMAATAQTVAVDVEQVECLPLARNTVVKATVTGDPAGSTVRLFFRRMHEEVEDFYWVGMNPSAGGYWGVLPRPEDHKLREHELDDPPDDVESDELWAAWWQAKEASEDRDPNDDLDDEIIRERASVGGFPEDRAWMTALDNDTFQRWLEDLENEPAEYYAAVFDASNELVAKSDMKVALVREECEVAFTPQEAGEALNLTIGETAPWQEGKKVFHWLCDGIVTRVNSAWIPRADEVCRSCVVALFNKRDFLVPATVVGVGGITTIIISDDPDPSPTRPTGF